MAEKRHLLLNESDHFLEKDKIKDSEVVVILMFFKRGVLKIFANITGKHLCWSLFFNKRIDLTPQTCNFIKKETSKQLFSCGI